MRPIIKWVGGKTQLLPEIMKRMPRDWNKGTYHEPFFGGGALYFALEPQRAIISDLNADLVMMYSQVRSIARRRVEHWLKKFQADHSQKHYEQIRTQWNKGSSQHGAPHRAAMFIYLNKTCFNGLWRVNRHGHFNVPMGDYKKPNIHDRKALADVSRLLASASLKAGDFVSGATEIERGDFVYYDPPYDPISATSSFTRYTGDFGPTHQEALADLAAQLVGRGVRVMLSNNNTAFIRKLYRDRGFRLHRVRAKRSINADTSKRGAITELIITGGYKCA